MRRVGAILPAGDAAAAALLLLLPGLLYTPALTGSRVFFERDIAAYWLPAVETLVRVVSQGSWPLWDPFEGFGLPLLADPGSQVLYPPTWLNLVLPPGPCYTVLVVLHTWLAGLGTYVLARGWGMRRLSALAAGVAFAASGPFVSLVSLYHHFMGAAWMPWVLAALDRARRRPGLRSAALLALAGAVQVLAGSGDMVLLTALFGLARVAGGVMAGEGVPGRAALRTAAGGVAGALGLAAAQWLPTAALLRQSGRPGMDAAAALYWSVHPGSLLELLVPAAASSLPLAEPVRAALFESREPFLASLYAGVAAAVLVAAFARGRRPQLAAALVPLVLFLLTGLGRHTPLLPLLLHVPGVALFRYPVKHMAAFALAWALLVGLAAEGGRAAGDERARRRAALAAAAGAVVAVAALGAAAVLHRWPDVMAPLLAAPVGWRASAVAGLVRKLVLVAAFAAAAAGLVAWQRRGAAGSPPAAAAVLLVAADLVVAGRGVNPLAPPELLVHPSASLGLLPGPPSAHRLYVPPPPTPWLNRQLVRGPAGWDREWSWTLGLQDALQAPAGARWGLRGSYDADFTGLAPRGFATMSAMTAHYQTSWIGLRLLRLGAVTDVIAVTAEARPDLLLAGEVATVFAQPVRAYRVPGAFPRAFVVSGARAASDDAARSLFADPAFDPARMVVLDSGRDVPPVPGFSGQARITDDAPDRLRVECEASHPGYLVVADAHHPGWRAWADGRPAEVRRGNVLFRAVAIPAGRHLVEMRYRPPEVVAGSALSTLSALALATLAVSRGRR